MGQRIGFRHSEESKQKISESARGKGKGGFNIRTTCDICGQEMSPANLGRHRKYCVAVQGLKLNDTQLTVKEVKRLRGSLRNLPWTLEEYLEHHNMVEGRCEICGEKDQRTYRLMPDHCHEHEVPRGLLCTRCNLALGGFLDSMELLRTAIEYLEKYRLHVAESDLDWD